MSGPERREAIELAALEVFAERGYHGASIDAIARRAGISVPVVYDHFESKLDLHVHLLRRTREELLAMWAQNLPAGAPSAEIVPAAMDAWVRYVETHPYAPRMYFVETTGLPEAQALHREIQDEARAGLGALLGGLEGGPQVAGSADPLDLEMAAEVVRSGLTGLAIWWQSHPEVPRERIVQTAVNAFWIGLERALPRP